jgi:hypothetical protein
MGRYVALVPMALGLAACGGGGDSGGGGALSLDPVARAATKTARSGGEHMRFRVRLRPPGSGPSLSITGSGEFDVSKHVGRASLRFAGLPQFRGPAEEILDGSIVYMRSPLLEGRLPPGKHWLKYDLAKQARSAGIEFSRLQGATSDPTQLLRYLQAASTGVEKVGPETVAGAATTHYSATLDFDKLARARPKERASIKRLEHLAGVRYVPVDVWIDRDDYVRKVKESMEMHFLPPGGATTRMVTSYELSAFGEHVDASPPPTDQVVDASSLGATGS